MRKVFLRLLALMFVVILGLPIVLVAAFHIESVTIFNIIGIAYLFVLSKFGKYMVPKYVYKYLERIVRED